MRQQQNRAAIQKVIDKNNLSIIGGEAGLKSRQLREQVTYHQLCITSHPVLTPGDVDPDQ